MRHGPDPFDDDDRDFDLAKDDGWSNDDLANRRHVDSEGRYAGPKGACPNDTDGDGTCGYRGCLFCGGPR